MMEKNTCWRVGKMLRAKGERVGMCKGERVGMCKGGEGGDVQRGEGGDVQRGRGWGCAKGERVGMCKGGEVTFQTHSYNVSSCQLTICDKDRAIPGRVRGV